VKYLRTYEEVAELRVGPNTAKVAVDGVRTASHLLSIGIGAAFTTSTYDRLPHSRQSVGGLSDLNKQT
jgi:hypothetical protein